MKVASPLFQTGVVAEHYGFVALNLCNPSTFRFPGWRNATISPPPHGAPLARLGEEGPRRVCFSPWGSSGPPCPAYPSKSKKGERQMNAHAAGFAPEDQLELLKAYLA